MSFDWLVIRFNARAARPELASSQVAALGPPKSFNCPSCDGYAPTGVKLAIERGWLNDARKKFTQAGADLFAYALLAG